MNNEEKVVARCVQGTVDNLHTVLSEVECLYGTEALIKILASQTDTEREAKMEAIVDHHVKAGCKPGPVEGVGRTKYSDKNATGEPVGDPLIHHAALSQRVSKAIVDAVATIVASAGEDPNENARLPGSWGLYAPDYLHPLPHARMRPRTEVADQRHRSHGRVERAR